MESLADLERQRAEHDALARSYERLAAQHHQQAHQLPPTAKAYRWHLHHAKQHMEQGAHHREIARRCGKAMVQLQNGAAGAFGCPTKEPE